MTQTLVATLGVDASALVVTVIETRRLLASRRLTGSWVAKYEANVPPEAAVDVALKTETAKANKASLESSLTTFLVRQGASAASVALSLITLPVITGFAGVLDPSACGMDYCAVVTGSTKKSVLVDSICAALSCAKAAANCCNPAPGELGVSKTKAASAWIIIPLTLGIVALALCCVLGAVIRFWRQRVKLMRARQNRTDHHNQHHQELLNPVTTGGALSPSGLKVDVFPDSPGSTPKGTPKDGKDGEAGPGMYLVSRGADVKATLAADSAAVGKLDPGDVVEVIEVLELGAPDTRLMARIAAPAGWMPLRDTKTGQHWARSLGSAEASSPKFAGSSPTAQSPNSTQTLHELKGEWRPQEGGVLAPGVIAVGDNGYTTYGGIHAREQDLLLRGDMIQREDGWWINPECSSSFELVWCKQGELSVIWQRVRPASEYSIGDKVECASDEAGLAIGSSGEVVGIKDGRIRVKYQTKILEVLPSQITPAEVSRHNQQGQFLVESLEGVWRLCEGDIMFPGVVTIGASGYTLYDGMHWAEQDILFFGERVARGDGWAVDMHASTVNEMMWVKPGERTITWKRVKPVSEYGLGDVVEYIQEKPDLPLGTRGTVVGKTDSRVRVKFPTQTFDVLPAEILAIEAKTVLFPTLAMSLEGGLAPKLLTPLQAKTVLLPALAVSLEGGLAPTLLTPLQDSAPQERSSPKSTNDPFRDRANAKDALASLVFEGAGADAARASESPRSPGILQQQDPSSFPPSTTQPHDQQPIELQMDELQSGPSPDKRPPQIDVDMDLVGPEPVPSTTSPFSATGVKALPPKPLGTLAELPEAKPAVDPVASATPSSIAFYPPGAHQATSTSAAPAEMMMVFPPGAEHPVLYQQVGTPVNTPTSPPSTVTPPMSPNLQPHPNGLEGFNARIANSKLAAVGPPPSSGPPSPRTTAPSRSGPGSPGSLQEAPPGAAEARATDSAQTSWWGGQAFQAVTGPIGSGMSALSSKFRRPTPFDTGSMGSGPPGTVLSTITDDAPPHSPHASGRSFDSGTSLDTTRLGSPTQRGQSPSGRSNSPGGRKDPEEKEAPIAPAPKRPLAERRQILI